MLAPDFSFCGPVVVSFPLPLPSFSCNNERSGCDEAVVHVMVFLLVQGPLSKKAYLGALKNFNIEEALPDINPCYHAFRVDPWETNRVWFVTAGHATFTGAGWCDTQCS